MVSSDLDEFADIYGQQAMSCTQYFEKGFYNGSFAQLVYSCNGEEEFSEGQYMDGHYSLVVCEENDFFVVETRYNPYSMDLQKR